MNSTGEPSSFLPPSFSDPASGDSRHHRVRAYVLGPYPVRSTRTLMGLSGPSAVNERSAINRLDEARGLAAAIDLDIISAELAPLSTTRPATYLGKGKVEELAVRIKEQDIGLVILDCSLSPVQQRNLEKAWSTKVIDRTGLILDIFGRRARTREGALQVELAHLTYQKSRLVRSWTHLERQRGGFGFLGGPGETQIEADRRLIQERMTRIRKDLDAVVKTRGLHRAGRARVPYPVVALVGYTNAGKSTLFNALTKADVLAQDMLFATLDPTARVVRLPHGDKIILTDTVGFISDLPTMLVAAFRATLEDVIEADLVLHVRDVAHEDTSAQAKDVALILQELGIATGKGSSLIEVWNKADLLKDAVSVSPVLPATDSSSEPSVEPLHLLVSALTGTGLPSVLDVIETRLAQGKPVFELTLGPTEGTTLNWLYEETEVIDRIDRDNGDLTLHVRLARAKVPRLMKRCPQAHMLNVE